jgi:hypothetical protein
MYILRSSLKSSYPALPDGIFSNQKCQLGQILESLAIKDAFCCQNLPEITQSIDWYILWSFWYVLPVLVCCTKINLATLVLPTFIVAVVLARWR